MKKILFFVLLLSAIVGVEAFAGTAFVTRTYDLCDFTILEVNNVVKVVYTQGDTYSVKLTGRKDLLGEMEVKATGGRLSVRAKKISGTADKVEVERGGVPTNIDTSRLNQF